MNFINNFNQIDILILILTIVSMIYGYSRGLIKEILSIFSLLISVYISNNLYPEISSFIKKYIEMVILADSISFAILFLFMLCIVDALNCVHFVGRLLMVRTADAHLTSTFLKVAFIVSVEGCRFKINIHVPSL